MTDPLVSIVTPVYNGEIYLKGCIQGVLKQTYKNFEYIILDNASTDGTAKIIEDFIPKDSRIKAFRNPATLDIIDNWNESLKYISKESKWVKFAFTDDILFPHCVEEMVRVGETDIRIGFVSAYHLKGRQVANVGLPMDQEIADGKEMLKRHIMRKIHVCLDSPNTVLYKRVVLDEMEGFDKAYLHADTELAFRILYEHHLGFVHQVLSWTSINKHSGASYAFFHGLNIIDYLRFAYKEISKYRAISLTENEMQQVSDYYAHEIALYVSAHLVHRLWKDIRNLWREAPGSIKKRILPALRNHWPLYARKFLGSIIHYKQRVRNSPTFKR